MLAALRYLRVSLGVRCGWQLRSCSICEGAPARGRRRDVAAARWPDRVLGNRPAAKTLQPAEDARNHLLARRLAGRCGCHQPLDGSLGTEQARLIFPLRLTRLFERRTVAIPDSSLFPLRLTAQGGGEEWRRADEEDDESAMESSAP
jgi:hypothetical protein